MPTEKASLFWEFFGSLDPQIGSLGHPKIMSYMQSYLTGQMAITDMIVFDPVGVLTLQQYDYEHGTDYASHLATLVFRLAELVCRSDGRVDEDEQAALRKLRTDLTNPFTGKEPTS